MSKARRGDVPGNSVVSGQEYQKQMVRLAELVMMLERSLDAYDEQETFVRSVRFKLPMEVGESVLAIVSAETPEGRVVAFHDGATFGECLRGLLERFRNKSLYWKEDQYG